MAITTRQVQSLVAGYYNTVLQVDKQQLFICKDRVDTSILPTEILVSYLTQVGYRIGATWYLTKQKFSPTTSKQVNQFANRVRSGGCVVEWVDSLEGYQVIK